MKAWQWFVLAMVVVIGMGALFIAAVARPASTQHVEQSDQQQWEQRTRDRLWQEGYRVVGYDGTTDDGHRFRVRLSGGDYHGWYVYVMWDGDRLNISEPHKDAIWK